MFNIFRKFVIQGAKGHGLGIAVQSLMLRRTVKSRCTVSDAQENGKKKSLYSL